MNIRNKFNPQKHVPLLIAVAFIAALVIIISLLSTTSDSGTIGDTIGGSSAPIIGLLSAILIYLSFKAQIDANNAVREEANFRYILEEFNHVKQSFTDFEYKSPSTTNTSRGKEAIKNLSEEIFTYYYVDFPMNRSGGLDFKDSVINANFLFHNYSIFINEVLSLKLSDSYRKIVEARIWLHFAEHIKTSVETISEWAVYDDLTSTDEEKNHKALEFKVDIIYLMNNIAPLAKSIARRNNL